jgi:hypothetical protein
MGFEKFSGSYTPVPRTPLNRGGRTRGGKGMEGRGGERRKGEGGRERKEGEEESKGMAPPRFNLGPHRFP